MTNIDNAERNRPKRFTTAHHAKSDIADLVKESLTKSLKGGIEPQKAAEQVIKAIREEQFHIFAEGGDSDVWRKIINIRLHEISNLQNPSLPVPP